MTHSVAHSPPHYRTHCPPQCRMQCCPQCRTEENTHEHLLLPLRIIVTLSNAREREHFRRRPKNGRRK